MEPLSTTIPDILIYEMDDGNPIYYQGYQRYLNGEAQLDELVGSSYLQSKIVTELIIFLSQNMDLRVYQILANEIGLQFADRSWRAADIAIFKKEALKNTPLNNKYLSIPPEIVIEIDTKADLSATRDPYGYFHKKTEQLLEHGVKKVIWIFTETKKVMIATTDADWLITSWEAEIEVMNGHHFNLADIVSADA